MKVRVACILAITVLTTASPFAMGVTRTFDFEGPAYGTPNANCINNPMPPMFNRAEYGYATKDFIVDPPACGQGVADDINANGSDSPLVSAVWPMTSQSQEIRFSWEDPTNSATWVRVITATASNVTPKFEAPVVQFADGAKLSMKIALYSLDASGNATEGQIEVAPIIRETGDALPIGEKGSTSGGTHEYVGVDSANQAAPYTPDGGVTLNANVLYQLEYAFGADNTTVQVTVTPLDPAGSPSVFTKSIVSALGNGDGHLTSANMKGTLDSLAIRKGPSDTTSKKMFVNVDDITITSTTPDPLRILAPVPAWATVVTVAFVDPDAQEVRLYKNNTLYLSQTAPISDPANRRQTFSVSGLQVGDVLVAKQVLGGVEDGGSVSAPVTVVGATILDDFNSGLSYQSDPGPGPTYDDSKYYGTHQCTYGTVSSGTFTGTNSPCLKYTDSGYTNGFYRRFVNVVRKTGTYRVKADIHVKEDPANPNGVRAWQLGVRVNGTHRAANNPACTCQGADADNGALLDAAALFQNYATMTTGDDTGLGPRTITTSEFTANEGDSIVISFSTAVTGGIGSSGRWRANSATWGTAQILIDNIALVEPEPCEATAAVSVQMPLVAGQTTVTVTGVNPTPEK
ncbi:MAG TPA: hypothetical protein PLC79_04670, partial [Phycisphaerae bacterium]|nr:hypothetical protein [Phycisphaerae bacterium]